MTDKEKHKTLTRALSNTTFEKCVNKHCEYFNGKFSFIIKLKLVLILKTLTDKCVVKFFL